MNTKIVVALIGMGGVIAGSFLASVWQYWFQERPRQKADKERKKLLVRMLEDSRFTWRKLETLKHVIGADDETTKRLLLEVGARASEDGEPLWGLINRNPFNEGQ